jgi:hypothetical protein
MHDAVVFGLPGFLGNIYFASAFVPIALEAIGDVSGDGVADLAHLGRRDDTGAVRIQIKQSDTKATVANGFLGDVGTPIQILGIGDANSDTWPDVALLVEDPFDGAPKIIVRDGKTGGFIRNIFLGAIRNPIAMTLLDDMNGSGDPELAVLGDDGLGTVRVQIKDPVSGQQIGNVDFPFWPARQLVRAEFFL